MNAHCLGIYIDSSNRRVDSKLDDSAGACSYEFSGRAFLTWSFTGVALGFEHDDAADAADDGDDDDDDDDDGDGDGGDGGGGDDDDDDDGHDDGLEIVVQWEKWTGDLVAKLMSLELSRV